MTSQLSTLQAVATKKMYPKNPLIVVGGTQPSLAGQNENSGYFHTHIQFGAAHPVAPVVILTFDQYESTSYPTYYGIWARSRSTVQVITNTPHQGYQYFSIQPSAAPYSISGNTVFAYVTPAETQSNGGYFAFPASVTFQSSPAIFLTFEYPNAVYLPTLNYYNPSTAGFNIYSSYSTFPTMHILAMDLGNYYINRYTLKVGKQPHCSSSDTCPISFFNPTNTTDAPSRVVLETSYQGTAPLLLVDVSSNSISYRLAGVTSCTTCPEISYILIWDNQSTF